MILIKDNGPLKEENGKLYIVSSKLKKSDRVFCDYDKEEKSVEVEFQKTGERAWFRTDVFFFPYTVTSYDYIGIYDKKDNSILTYKLGDLSSADTPTLCYLRIELIPTGLKRPFTKDDIPFQKECHVLALPKAPEQSITANLTEKELDKLNRLTASIKQCNMTIANARLQKDAVQSVLLTLKDAIKDYDKMISRKVKDRNAFASKIKQIEKDRTCYGCDIPGCPVAKDFNNERCDKYDDGLPF